MGPVQHQIRQARRTPPTGVSGVTLLMLVTLVLTASPALGRARHAVAAGPVRVADEQTAPQQAQQTLRQRESARRHVRPDAAQIRQSVTAPCRQLSSFEARVRRGVDQGPAASDRMGLASLDLPPPLA